MKIGILTVKRATKARSPYLCIGCGKMRARRPKRYCRVCRNRLSLGYDALDCDDVLTKTECRAAIKRLTWLGA